MAQHTQVGTFQATLQKSQDWLRELVDFGEFIDENQAYSAFRAVLHALRDRLTVEEGAHFAAQLPMLIRGIYYEGWKPSATPVKIRTKDEFIESVNHYCRGGLDVDLEDGTRAVFSLLAEKVTGGEIEDVKHLLPEPIRDLWP